MSCFPSMTWESIDATMTFDRLDAMQGYWKRHPPTHIMIAAYLGIGEKEKPQDIGAFVKMMGARDCV